MRMYDLSTERIQRTIDAFNHDRTIPMVIIGSAAIKLHMRERMPVWLAVPAVDVLSSIEGAQALVHEAASGQTGPMSLFESDTLSGHVHMTLVPRDTLAQRGALPMHAYTGFDDTAYSISFADACSVALPDVQTGLLKMPLADVIAWKLSLPNTTIDDVRQIRDVLDVATIDGDLTAEQIDQFDELRRQKAAHARFTRRALDSEDEWSLR